MWLVGGCICRSTATSAWLTMIDPPEQPGRSADCFIHAGRDRSLVIRAKQGIYYLH
ncbi:MAG TPA: hypothetical protein VFU28_17225 [Vicinamibacterales bacterium]|nr:hypothetical protein [Vicinamibacterales bacterium]